MTHYMTIKELQQLFHPSCYIDGHVLLVSPDRFHELKECTIGGSRMSILISRGKLDINICGKDYEMEERSFLDVMDMAEVKINNMSDNLQAWCVVVTFKFVTASLKNLRPVPTEHMFERMNIPLRHIPEDEHKQLERPLIMLKNILSDADHYYRKELSELYYKCFSLELGNIMFKQESSAGDVSPYICKRDFITLSFFKLVTKHYAEQHYIDFYADTLCVSPKHLNRTIKETTGKTPHAIICEEITIQAMAMLEDENLTIGQIASNLNFSDQAAFCKFFKKQKNVSPMAYRRKKCGYTPQFFSRAPAIFSRSPRVTTKR